MQFQGNSHGSHVPEDVISAGFRYMKKIRCVENGCDCLSGFPHDFWIISIKSVTVIFFEVPQWDRFFFGEGSLRNRLSDLTSPQWHEERCF